MMARRKPKAYETPWTQTAAGHARYLEQRAEAQAKANLTGHDYGLCRNDVFRDFSVFMLPQRQHRFGHELTCEVVSCTDLSRCPPGHGPVK